MNPFWPLFFSRSKRSTIRFISPQPANEYRRPQGGNHCLRSHRIRRKKSAEGANNSMPKVRRLLAEYSTDLRAREWLIVENKAATQRAILSPFAYFALVRG